MRLTNLKATNFLTLKELDYNFVNHPILIQGENLDDDSQESNGAGKTSLQCAIEYCLMSTTSRKVKDNELIHFGEDKSDIELTVYCDIRKEELYIKRTLSVKGSAKIELKINNKDVSFSTVRDGENFIMDWLQMSKEDIQNFFIVNKERYSSFFSSANSKKIELISRFSNSNLIEGVDKLVQEDCDKIDKEICSFIALKNSVEGKKELIEEKIEKEKVVDFDEVKKAKIEEIETRITLEGVEIINLNNSNTDYQKENLAIELLIAETVGKLETIQKSFEEKKKVSFEVELTKIELSKEKVSKQVREKENDKKKLKNELSDAQDLIDEINRNIKGSVKCPKCSHEFLISNPDIDIQEEKETLPEAEKVFNKLKVSIDDIDNSINTLNKEINDISKSYNEIQEDERNHKTVVRRLVIDIEEIEDRLNDLKKSISRNLYSIEKNILKQESIESNIKVLKEQIESIKTSKKDVSILLSLEEELKEYKVEAEKLQFKIDEQEDILFNKKQWIVSFKKFNGFLANKSLKILQGYCNKYLQEIGSDLQIKWEGFKMKADGTLSDKITPYVIRDGEERDFWSYSGGERARLDFSMILTIQGIINASHPYGGLDFLSLDEVLESIDGMGLGSLIKSMSGLNKTILLTTHVTDRNISSNILLVRKQNGVSTLIQ